MYGNVHQGAYVPRTKRETGAGKAAPFTCFHCGVKGHTKKECWAWKRLNEGGRRPPNSSAATSSNMVQHPIDEEMILQLLINGKPGRALADSGSQTTIISNRFFKSIRPRPEVETPPFSCVTGVGGNRTEVVGSIQAVIEIGVFRTVFPVHILKNTRYDVIIGRDFMDELVSVRGLWC